jgi:drug/metabolite transporter (DMT)-like permease
MVWLIYAVIGIIIWSFSGVADRFFLVQHVHSKRFYVVVPALLQFPVIALVALVIPVHGAPLSVILAAIAEGALEAISLYFLYVAVSGEEVSRVFALSSFGPLLTLLLGWVFLHESLSQSQLWALGFFVTGGFILAAKFDSGSWTMSKGIKPLFISILLTSSYTILLKFAFIGSDFWTAFFFSRLGFFCAGLCILFVFRNEIFAQWGELTPKIRTLLIGNQIISVSGHAFYYLAISLASAALVQSVLGSQSAVVLVFALIASWLYPGVIQESLRPRDLSQKVVGICFVITAAILALQ